jgi:hypothetical protein
LAKSAKTPSGKGKGRAKKADDVVEAEIVDEITGDLPQGPDELPHEDVPEDSDYDVVKQGEVDAAPESADTALDEAATDKADVSGEAAISDAEIDAKDVADEVKAEFEDAGTPAPIVAEAAPKKGGGLFGSILGGMIAAAIGFGVAMFYFPNGWQGQSAEAFDALKADVTAQGEKITTQGEQITAAQGSIDATGGELSALRDRTDSSVETLQQELTARQEEIAALNARIDSLTKSDGTTKLPDDVQILLNTQKEELDTLRGEVAGLTANAKAQMEAAAAQQVSAEEAEARVKARGALQRVRLALASGEPFADALPDISGAVDVPEGLQAVAEAGAPTPAAIQAAFPEAAREALAQALRETAGSDTQSRLQLFFKDQLGARSLTPRDGDDPDAVLSRAEAAVKADDFETALQEIEVLPDAAKAQFDSWRESAQARISAVSGYEAVSDALNEN